MIRVKKIKVCKVRKACKISKVRRGDREKWLLPMKLRQKGSTGEWFLWEYSSVLSGIRIPAAEDPWA